MTRVVLGNRHAIQSPDHGETFEALPKGKRATVVDLPDDQPVMESLKAITEVQGVWTYHAVGPSREAAAGVSAQTPLHVDAKPAWVASDDDALAQVLALHFGGIEVRKLEDPYEGRFDPGSKSKGGSKGGKQAPMLSMFGLMLALPSLLFAYARTMLALKVNTGHDFQYNQMAGSASATAVGKWVGLTANVTAPAAGDTTLTAEITTAGGGLIRKVSTPAHTTGTNTYTLTTVFTANGSDSLPVTIGKRGVFDAITSGNLIFETLVSPTATLSAVGDSLTLTDTITM